MEANALPGQDTVSLPAGTYRIDPAMADRMIRLQMDFPETELDLLLQKNVPYDDAVDLAGREDDSTRVYASSDGRGVIWSS